LDLIESSKTDLCPTLTRVISGLHLAGSRLWAGPGWILGTTVVFGRAADSCVVVLWISRFFSAAGGTTAAVLYSGHVTGVQLTRWKAVAAITLMTN